MNDTLGYVATGVVLCSYFFKQPSTLRRIQALAAVLWMVYGVLIDSKPVLVANILVASIAIWSSFKLSPKASGPTG